MNETEEPKVWMPGVSPALFESQSAELTKLKSDVERLRKGVVEVRNQINNGLEAPFRSEFDIWEAVDGYLESLSRALEETK